MNCGRLLIAIVLFILSYAQASAQTSSTNRQGGTTMINVIVKDQQTGYAIPDAAIQLTSPDGRASALRTASNGQLQVPASGGKFSFRISASGYESLETFFISGSETTIEANVNLDPLPTSQPDPLFTLKRGASQTVLSGYIRDADANSPLSNAVIKVGDQTTTTNSKGYFQLPLLTTVKEMSKLRIHIEKAGYVSYTIENFYATADAYSMKIALTAITSARNAARATEQTETHKHGLYDRTDTDEQARYAATPATARVEDAAAVLAVSVPTSIRVGTSCSCTSCSVVQVMSLEAYTQSGLDDEWIASWGAASLRAGAVAYRSYGAWYVQHPVASSYDIAATTCNQVWQSDVNTNAKNAAIFTAGTVLIKSNAIVRSEYSAENNNSGCGNGYSGTGSSWPCISDARCAGRAKNGHGRGMCQWGSSFWASDKDYLWILNHYYNPGGVTVQLPPASTVTTITFSVVDQASGSAVASASVAVTKPDGTTSTLTTNASGQLTFGADAGTYGFAFSKSGYTTLRTSFVGGPNATVAATINLDLTSAARIAVVPEVSANTMTVNGYVHDASTNAVLEGAQVQVDAYTATSDHKGFFSISMPAAAITRDKAPASVSIRSTKAGYGTHTINRFYNLADTYTLNINLPPAGEGNRQAGSSDITEDYSHGLFDRKITEEPATSNAHEIALDAVAAATVPTSIRVVTNCACATCAAPQVQVMSLEAYVQTGLDDEWLSSWNAASLQAGAVAYRSRGAYYVQHPVASNYDLSNAACHQTWQDDRATNVKNAAIATRGIVLVKDGAIVNADYCAESNNAGCGNGFSGTGTTWPCIADARCAGRTLSGHGRGMCQWGSSFWGTDQSYTWILDHYYGPNATTIQLPGAIASSTNEEGGISRLRLSPNPSTGSQVKLSYDVSEAQAATITVLDGFGRTIRVQQATLQAGRNNLNLNTAKLKPGVYTVQVRYGTGKIESSKLMVGSK